MDNKYKKQGRAIKNWHKIVTRVHVIRSICFNIVDVDFSGEPVNDPVKKKWYESGSYIIMPNTNWYLVWDVNKSILYMISLYTLAFAAAFQFKGENEAATFELLVDVVQIIDILHTFLTSIKVRQLSQYTLKYRKSEMDAIESK